MKTISQLPEGWRKQVILINIINMLQGDSRNGPDFLGD